MRDNLIALLRDLDGVAQDPAFHPEGDALTHSLQVFDRARERDVPAYLLAAALFHDVGKAGGTRGHAERGAAWLRGLIPTRSVLLVKHHMDLVHGGRRTKRRLAQHGLLNDLERLRRFDVAGRRPGVPTTSPVDAVEFVLNALFPAPRLQEDDRP